MAQIARTKTVANRGGAPPITGLERSGAAAASAAGSTNGVGATAADAAAAAEFASKKYVWVPDKEQGYLSGWVVREEEGGSVSVVSLTTGGEGSIKNVPTDDLSKMNPPKFEKAEDIADLTFLNEASVVHNLRQRYFSNLIYTYSGLFLVAVNPYHPLPIYTDAIVAAYKGRRREENAPHVFALADGAMRNMLEHRENQSLLITGESGAGKTENTKKVIQYLAAVAADTTANQAPTQNGTDGAAGHNRDVTLTRSGSTRYVMDQLRGVEPVGMKKLGLLERQILQANPILEAFGNAQTIRNNNSSRFGKFVRIEFTSLGAIAGANIDWYLLEKSRVTNRSEKERSFHIFYQLLRSDERELKSKLLLTSSPEDYGYLKKTRKHVEGVDDRLEWGALREALDTVGFSQEEQQNLFRVVASILHVGNLELADDRSEQARIKNTAQIEKVCHVLGVPEQEFANALLRPRVKAGREWVTQARTKKQVTDEMAALCKTLYEKTFSYIVDRINKALDRPTSKSTFIGVLDIAGFEIFETNSFEQLCINYTNEKLQQFFNHHMFVLEQEEYAREGIEWDFVNFGLDLQPTIDLIESTTPIGILSCLDEECIMPKATDLTFTEKLNRIWGTQKDGTASDPMGAAMAAERGVAHGSTKYAPTRFAQGFTIKHYAGSVEYHTDGWLDKNKDPLNDNLTRVMSESTDRFVASLFAEYAVEDEVAAAGAAGTGPATGPKRRIKRGAFRTVGQRHKEQLSSLMTQLGSTQPHFVRCIVPNSEKKPGKIEVPLVLEQLRCNGVLEGIRIARLGYPNRLLFSEFRNRYEVLTPGIIPRGYMDGRKACQRMVEALELDRATFKIGTSKIFFKAGVLAEMEERRDRLLYDIFSRFEAACRMFTARRQMKKILNRAAAIRTIQRNARVYAELREWPWWQLYTKVRPLLSATRHDEELKKKELELALITERAQRDEQEKQKLEALKHSLEAEKKKVEDALESERALLLDKDQLLARSKDREATLEEDLAAMQADIDLLESQLERALAAQQVAEQSHKELKTAFDTAAEHLLRLEADQKVWASREVELTGHVDQHTAELEKLKSESSALQAERDALQRKIAEREEDIERTNARMAAAVTDLEKKLAGEVAARESERQRLSSLETQTRQSSHQLAEISRTVSTHEEAAKKKEAELAQLRDQLAQAHQQRDMHIKTATEHKSKLDTAIFDLGSVRAEHQEAVKARAALQAELDETRKLMTAKSGEDEKQRQIQQKQAEELNQLRQQHAKAQDELTKLRHTSAEDNNKLKAQVASLQEQHATVSKAHSEATSKLDRHEKKITEMTAAVAAAESARRAAEGEHQSLSDKHSAAEAALGEVRKARSDLERQLAAATSKHQNMEDALLELERSQAEWKTKHEQASTELEAESKRRELLQSAAKQHERQIGTFSQQMAAKDKELAQLKEQLKLTEAELRKAQSMTNKTIVEHVHVLEEAKKYTDRQLADAQSQLQELAHYTKTLEKSKARLVSDNEDLTRELSQLQKSGGLAMRNVDPASKKLEAEVAKLNAAVKEARQARDEALSNARRRDLQADEALSRQRQQYEARIAELEKNLKGSQAARSHTFMNLEEIVKRSSNGGDDTSFRRRLLEELRAGHDELEQDIAAKADLLRSHKMNGSTPKKEKPLYAFGNVAPQSNVAQKRASLSMAGESPAARLAAEDAQKAQARVQSLQNQVTDLELRVSSGQRARADLEAQLADLRQQLDQEKMMRNEDLMDKSRVQTELQELQINTASSSHAVAEAHDAVRLYRTKMDDYQTRVETLEIEKLKAEKGENLAKMTLADTERNLQDAYAQRRAAEEHIQYLEGQLREFQARLAHQGIDPLEVEHIRARAFQEFEMERRRYKADVENRDAALQQQRARFQQELEALTADVEAHRAALAEARNENRALRQRVDDGNAQDSRSANPGWQREKELLEHKVSNLNKVYQESLQAQRDGQAQAVNLLAQVRDLRAGLDESELKYSQLQAAYNSLVQEAGVDQDMIDSLQKAVERYKAQADLHMANWRKNTQELEQQAAQLRHSIRRPGSTASGTESVLSSATSPSRFSRQQF